MPIKTKPAAIAEMEAPDQPFSTCVQIGKHFHFSGVVAPDDSGAAFPDENEQIIEVMQKMCTLLEVAGLTTDDVYSATIMLSGNMHLYPLVNNHWKAMFDSCEIKPRRKAFAVAALPFDCIIEIEFDAIDQSKD